MNSPFNESKYNSLLEGLEVSEVRKSDLERTLRIDAEFYKKENLNALDILSNRNLLPITNLVSVSDGNHMKISDFFTEEDGLPYYRGQDIYNFFIEQTENPLKIEERAFNFPYLKRSHLKKGDVLLSIVGAIIGNLSLVKTDQQATCSCKLAIMRPTNIQPEFLAIFLKSKYGQNQVQKFRRGTAQTGLILEDFDQIIIPEFSSEFKEVISDCVEKAFDVFEESKQTYQKAEDALLKEIKLTDIEFDHNPVNIKSFKDSFIESGRLDAESYQPKYDQIMSHIKMQNHERLKNLVDIRKSVEPGTDHYSEEGLPFLRVSDYDKFDIHEISKKLSPQFCADNAELVEKLKPKKDSIMFSKDGTVGIAHLLREDKEIITSGAILNLKVKNTKVIDPEYLTLVLNSEVVKLQAERDAGGSIILHWRVNEIENVLIPIIAYDKQKEIANLVEKSFQLRRDSEKLLEAAKQAIEIAIEKEDTEGLKHLKYFTTLT